MNTERIEIAHELGNYYIERLLKADEGRVKSKHKSSVEEIKKIMTSFQLEAEVGGYRKESVWTLVGEFIALPLFFAGIVSVLVLISAVVGTL